MLNLKRYVHAAFLGLAVVFGGVADAARTIVPAEFQNQGVATIAALKALPVSGLSRGVSAILTALLLEDVTYD